MMINLVAERSAHYFDRAQEAGFDRQRFLKVTR
jgi:hypothetical protein